MPMDKDFLFQPEELERALEILVTKLSDRHHVLPEKSSVNIPEHFPDHGIGGAEALQTLASSFFPTSARLGHPGYFAHMDPPTPWMSWAGALWAASCNQNLLHTDTGSGARELEEKIVAWLCQPFGMNGGHLVPGSTIANITALWSARELKGVRKVIVSEMAHLSIRKAASLLNLTLHEIPTDKAHKLQVDAVGDIDFSDAAVVLTAGTVAAGAIDPLDAFPEAAWRHVDAAWAGPLRFTRHAGILDGIEHADSVSMSAHKWLFQPKESAIIMFRQAEEAHHAISFDGGYLATPNIGMLGSHGATALPLAVTLLAWGREGITERIEHCMQLADRLAARIAREPKLELFGAPVTGVVIWRPRNAVTSKVHERMEDAFVSLTKIGEETWFRSVAANPNADPDRVVESVLAAIESD